MKILLLTDEVWNDRIHGNNVLSNWFDGFPAEFAHIYCSPGLPNNRCCKKYYQITDKMMLSSIIYKRQAGCIVTEMESDAISPEYTSTDIGNIGFLRRYFGNFLRLCKNIVWTMGNYDSVSLKEFIEDFSPDIIFSPRMATPKMLKLERYVIEIAKCPMVAFTGDNEYSLKMFSLSPIAWLNRVWVRKELKNNESLYSLYYTLSNEQKLEYEKTFSFKVKILRKCTNRVSVEPNREFQQPIRLIYCGKLYCNRWKTLARIGRALSNINKNEKKIVLDIYTKDVLSAHLKSLLLNNDAVTIHEPISPDEVLKKYKESDIALHIESFDLKYRYATRVSFSTKIIDCLSAGCAVLVVAWEKHSGLTYLREEDAALCISQESEIEHMLLSICNNPELVSEYAIKAKNCCERNHDKKKVSKMIMDDFMSCIEKNNF